MMDNYVGPEGPKGEREMSIFEYYKEKSRETAIYPNTGNNIAYPTLGLCNELGDELYTAIISYTTNSLSVDMNNLSKEIGDCFWYITTTCDEANLQFDDIQKASMNIVTYADLTSNIREATIESCKLAGIVKKIMRDNNNSVTDDKRNKIRACLEIIVAFLTSVCNELSLSLEVILVQNIEKLASRKERGKLQGDGDNR
jgi:NTP pyrophosphatase (non-canonical NTP hydrolase)